MKPPEFEPENNSPEPPGISEREKFYSQLSEDRLMYQICCETFPQWKAFINEAGQVIEERRSGRKAKFRKVSFKGVIDCQVTRFNLWATLISYISDTTTFETIQLSFGHKKQLRMQAGPRQEPSCFIYDRVKTKRAEAWRVSRRANLGDVRGYARILAYAQDPKCRVESNEDDQIVFDGS